MKKNHIFRLKGLTLIELVVVIGILGIMSAIAVSFIKPVQQLNKGNDGRRKGDLTKIQSALELYRFDNGFYPVTLTQLTSGSPQYLESIPTDPRNSGEMVYTYTSSPPSCDNSATKCLTYTLKACLENTADSAKDATDSCTSSTLVSYTVKNP